MIFGIWSNLKLELNIKRKSISPYLYFIMFFALSLLAGLAAGGAFANASVNFGIPSKVFVNSNVALTAVCGFLSAFSIFVTGPMFGQAVVKDFENRFEQIIYTSPVNRRQFLVARFTAAFVIMFFIVSAILLGQYVASVSPFILASARTENRWLAYVFPLGTILLPNIFIFGSIFFFIASRAKRMTPVYVTTIILFMGWMLSTSMTSEIENKLLAALLDPFGITATLETIKYWSVHDLDVKLVHLESFLLYNRALWVSIGSFCLGLGIFNFSLTGRLKRSLKDKREPTGLTTEIMTGATLSSRSEEPENGGRFSPILSIFWVVTQFEFRRAFRSVYFKSITLAGVCYMFVAGQQVGKIMGTNSYPVTYLILDFVGGSFDLFLIIIITFLSGEIIWRDRDAKIEQIVDASPVKNGVLLLSKLTGLVAVVATLLLVVIGSGVLIQLVSGYHRFELDLYFKHVYGLRLISFVNIIGLAFFLQIILNNKYLAHAAMILYYLFYVWAPSLGLDRLIYNFNAAPSFRYSDMNGFGHVLPGYFLFKFYWLSMAGLLITVAFLFWPRGQVQSMKQRWHEALRRRNQTVKVLMLSSGIIFFSLGAVAIYNTDILNSYVPETVSRRRSLAYEKKYETFMYEPQLSVSATLANVDIYASRLKVNLHYAHTLTNKTETPVENIFLNTPLESNKLVRFEIKFDRPVQIIDADRELGVVIYRFKKPLAPNESSVMTYAAQFTRAGTPNAEEEKNVNHNGTFFNNGWNSVTLGYKPTQELTDSKTREKLGLGKRERIAKITNLKARAYNLLARDASWINFEAIVSTDLDQIAVSPGYLQRTWVKDDRKYFHYKMDQKVLNFYSFLSARYLTKRDKWKDVNIEIFYTPGHEYNLDRMIGAAKDSLAYFEKHYGPYQFKQYRVLEFPRYAGFAQSFPNTVPFSESIGFIAKVQPDHPKDVDYPYFVTAHEFAHQYWGHQIIPAAVQGAFFPVESFAEFTALLILEEKYGHAKMKRFLRYELERYLFGRGQEKEYESPLALSEGQAYVHYQKGSLALFSLKELFGIKIINSALKEYLQKFKFQEPPYTVATDFVDILKSKVARENWPLIEDHLEKIILFDNRPERATYRKLTDGNFEITLKVKMKKLESDGNGKETPLEFSQSFDVAAVNSREEIIFLEKRAFKNGENEIRFRLAELPEKVGIDPLNYTIDKSPDDNLVGLTELE